MAKNHSSVFNRRSTGIHFGSKPFTKRPTVPKTVKPGNQIYDGINYVSSILEKMQEGLDTVFNGAPYPLRIYMENSMLSLHEMINLMASKLPSTATEKVIDDVDKNDKTQIVSRLEEIDSIFSKSNTNVSDVNNKYDFITSIEECYRLAKGKQSSNRKDLIKLKSYFGSYKKVAEALYSDYEKSQSSYIRNMKLSSDLSDEDYIDDYVQTIEEAKDIINRI